MEGPLDRSNAYMPLAQILKIAKANPEAETLCLFPNSVDIIIALAKASAGVTVIADKPSAGLFRAAISEGKVKVIEACYEFKGSFGAALFFEGIKGSGCAKELIEGAQGSLKPASRAILLLRKRMPLQEADKELDALIRESGLKRIATMDLGFFLCVVYEKPETE